jgi:hypothetical protein
MDNREELKVIIIKSVVFILLVGVWYIGTWLLTCLPDIEPGKKLVVMELKFWGTVTFVILFILTAIGDIVHWYIKKHRRIEST